MTKNFRQAMKELPKSKDLGTYHAEAGKIKAKLTLRADIKILGLIDSGMDWYVADVKFFIPCSKDDEDRSNVSAHYSSNVLGEIFAKMKAAESGIEEFLREKIHHQENWKETRNVMRCIFSLEDQTKHLYQERQEAGEQRNLQVHGERHPYHDD